MRSDVFILPQIVSIRFHVLFHSPQRGSFHLSLAVLFAIGDLGVFSLTRWSSRIHTGFHVSHTTREPNGKRTRFNDWTFTIYGTGFSCFVSHSMQCHMFGPMTWSLHYCQSPFRLFPFRSPLLWESLLLSFPSATKMFQFTELTFSSL